MPYPTPDKPAIVEFVCKPIYLPKDETLTAVLYGLFAQMCKSYFWVNEGTWQVDDLVQYLRQGFEMSDQLEECGMSCEQLIECLATDPDTKQAFVDLLSELGIQPKAGDYPPVPMPTANTASNLLPQGYVCDNDHLFGMSRWIVTQLDKATRQFLGQIELLTDPVELGAVFADNVEGVSWFGSGIEMAAWLQDQLEQWYDIAYTQTAEDTLSCEIFCLIKDDCELTIDKILEAYAVNAITPLPDPNDWIDVMNWLIDKTFNADLTTVATYHYFLAQALRFGGSVGFFDGFRGLKQVIATGSDETDNDWNILCNCATEWCYEFDFTLGSIGNFCLLTGLSPTANGIESIFINGLAENAKVALDLGAPTILTEVTVEWKYDGIPSGTNDKVFVQMMDGTSGCDGNNNQYTNPSLWNEFDPPLNTNVNSATWNNTNSPNKQWIGFQLFDYNAGVESCYLRKISFKGTGTPPPNITPNC